MYTTKAILFFKRSSFDVLCCNLKAKIISRQLLPNTYIKYGRRSSTTTPKKTGNRQASNDKVEPFFTGTGMNNTSLTKIRNRQTSTSKVEPFFTEQG
jgi:hypothetical protein